tara:strand:- start:166 stop:408 length:243 start_codon:yes stop_codon:yes gene_type:complete
MTFENTYLMLLYFKNKKNISPKKTSSKTVSSNDNTDKIIIDLENDIVNYCLKNNNNSDETIDNRRYPYNKKNRINKVDSF